MIYYLYKNTDDGVCEIGKFTNEDRAIEYMEYLAINNLDPRVLGYAVRDYKLKTLVEYEV